MIMSNIKIIYIYLSALFQAVLLMLSIGMIQLMFKLRYSNEVIHKVGLPFDYYFLSFKELHGFDITNFLLDVIVCYIPILLLRIGLKKLTKT
jgi:hypothetical protein